MTGFEKILESLTYARADYILVGGYACIAYGSQARTDDLDVCYERTAANYKKLILALAPINPRLRDRPGGLSAPFDEHSLAQGTNFTLITDEGSLDLLGELSGVGGYSNLIANSQLIDLGGISCRIASLDDIIRSKSAADRPKDRERLPELKALRLLKARTEEADKP